MPNKKHTGICVTDGLIIQFCPNSYPFGLTDICRLYVPADKRTTFPTAFLYRWQHGDTRLHGISERLDYIWFLHPWFPGVSTPISTTE